MGDKGMKKTVIGPLGLLAVSERAPARQSITHVQGGHPE